MRIRLLLASFVAVLALAIALPACTNGPSPQTAPTRSRGPGAPAVQEHAAGGDVGEASGEGEEGEQLGDEKEGEEDADSATGPEDWILAQRSRLSGVPQAALDRAGAQAAAVAAQTRAQAPAMASARWSFAGPTNIGGRVLDIAVDPNASNTIYVATASGGVWKSTDAGSTMKAAWPASNPQPIGAIAAASDGTLYAGTGEAGPGGGSITYAGRGIYKSTDSARTWQKAGRMPSPIVGRILIDPTDPQRIFVAGTGDLFNSGGGRGVYRSTDGGATWQRVLKGATTFTGAVDLAMDPSNPDRIYAAMWDHHREPDLRTYGGKGSGIYRSTDGGDTWSRLAGGLPAPGPNVGRIGIAVSPNASSRLYAIVIQAGGTYEGFYRSNDGGDTWTKLAATGLSGSQSTYGWWFGRVWVDPADKNHVFAAGVPLEQSTDGGQTWGSAGGVHADQHAMIWDPKVANRVYLGNDGGVYRSSNNGNGGWTSATVQPYTQFYSVDVSEQDDSRIVGGAQDNGVNRSWPGGGWNGYVGGDGLAALIDPTNQNNVYGCSQYGVCSRSTNGGDSSFSFGFATSDRFNWFSPVVFDPSNPQTIYFAGNRLNRSTNGAQTFSVISPDLSGGPGRDPSYPFGTITTIAASKTDSQELFAGTDDGRLWYSKNLGGSWTRAADPDLPSYWVTRVAVDPTNANVAYVTFSGYRSGANAPYVLRTNDGGATWTDITGNLPTAPVNDIVVDGGALYVATDTGVYRTTDGGATWRTLGKGLPNAPVDDIELVTSKDELFAGTFGRGMWKVSLSGL
jgi:photosystem II stability/assembly factor-like uncharacterized protein